MFVTVLLNLPNVSAESIKIDSELNNILSVISDDDVIPVSIWFNDINKSIFAERIIDKIQNLIKDDELSKDVFTSFDIYASSYGFNDSNLSFDDIQKIISVERKCSKEIYDSYNKEQINNILSNLNKDDIIYISSYAPNIIINLNKTDVKRIEKFNCVEFIYYDDESIFTEESNVNEYASSSSNFPITFDKCLDAIDSNSSCTGAGIKVGMIDSKLPNIKKNVIASSNIVIDPYVTYSVADHATIIASQLVGNYSTSSTSFTGMIPDATLYCTSIDENYTWKSRIEWLIDNNVNVINISNALVDERYTQDNDVSRWIDHVSSQHNVTIVAAVGYLSTLSNGLQNISPLAFSKNAIVVGAIDIVSYTNGIYLFGRYSGDNQTAYSNSGLYYPHIVAPSNPGEIPKLTGPSINSQVSGNSFSAPFVVGAIVQLIDVYPNLATNPTLIKSLIMVGSNGEKSRVNDDTSGTDMDREYGAGVVNVQNSIDCLSTSTVNKMYSGQYLTNDSQDINLKVNISESGNVRMALNWQSSSYFDSHEYHYSSENLHYYGMSFIKLTAVSPNGNVYTSFDVSNPFQLLVFDVPNDDLGTYSITVSRYGPTGYTTPISLAMKGVDSII
jgi:hypothetical protein